MTRSFPALFSFLLATSAAAGVADLRVTMSVEQNEVRPGETIRWTATLENLGPDDAHHVFFASYGGARCHDESIEVLAAGRRITVECASVAPGKGYWIQLSAGADITREGDVDPDRGNDRAYEIVEIITAPDLYLSIGASSPLDAGLPFSLPVIYGNFARTTATGATLTMALDATLTKVPDNCAVAGNSVTCTLGSIEPWPRAGGEAVNHTLLFEAIAPDASESPISGTVEIHANEADADPPTNVRDLALTTYRTFFVANTDDSGEGSLRSAITAANAGCLDRKPCKISFRIPPAGSAWQTIRPESPLPAIGGDEIFVDGATQRRYFGDTNPNGPEIELNGSRLASGNGLHLDFGCGGLVSALAINGFPDNGIFVTTQPCDDFNHPRAIAGNFIGTDPTGTKAVPNGRGIFLDLSSPLRTREYTISDNVISGNLHSGVFIANAANTYVYRNLIGLNATHSAPLGNGASGIYFGDAVIGAEVRDNYIGFNRDFGIAINPRAHNVASVGNSFQSNGQLAIDFGLDGVTASVPDYAEGPAGSLEIPVITSARYDAATDSTVIEGNVPNPRRFVVAIYANDAPDPSGYGEGQYFLGNASSDAQGGFTLTWSGHLPGPWVAVTATAVNTWGFGLRPRAEIYEGGYSTTTSEFSRTVRATE